MAVAGPSTTYLVRPGATRDELAALRHRGQPLYTQGEIDHLVDVRALVSLITWLGAAGALGLAGACLAAARRPTARRVLAGGLRLGAWLTVGGVAAAGLLAAVAWPILFVGFHEVLFEPGTWQFPSDSSLIRLFPERFWFDTAVALCAIIGLQALLGLLAARRLAR
jgi:uncharacterized membrane protein